MKNKQYSHVDFNEQWTWLLADVILSVNIGSHEKFKCPSFEYFNSYSAKFYYVDRQNSAQQQHCNSPLCF
jgi:hypothetical protein